MFRQISFQPKIFILLNAEIFSEGLGTHHVQSRSNKCYADKSKSIFPHQFKCYKICALKYLKCIKIRIIRIKWIGSNTVNIKWIDNYHCANEDGQINRRNESKIKILYKSKVMQMQRSVNKLQERKMMKKRKLLRRKRVACNFTKIEKRQGKMATVQEILYCLRW